MSGSNPKSDPSVSRNGKSKLPRPAKQIQFKNKSLGLVTQESLDAIAASNNPPTLFQKSGVLVRVRRIDEDLIPEPLSIDSLRYHLGRVADFVRVYFGKREGDGDNYRPEPPPLDFVRDLLASPSWDETVFPMLKGIVRCPYFTAQGELVTAKGYHAGSQLWYEPDPGQCIDPVPDEPSGGDLEAAKRWIRSELLADFPFQSDADRSNAVAYMLTPFVREMVPGQVPLALFEAPVAGTGKGLLVNAIATPSIGGPLETIPQRDSEEEWRKAFTAKLIECPTFILLDNLTGTLRSPALEAILTTGKWSDRVLGETRMVRLKLRSIWMLTGNNLQLGGDLPRRVVWVRLDAKMERPEERGPEKFKHPDLLRWAAEHRPKLIWSILVLIQNWIAKGRVPGTEVMGSYESWAATLGGVLRDAGLNGFLKNVQERRRDGDEDLEHLKRFVLEWLKAFQFEKVTVSELFELVATSDLLPYVMSAESEIGRRQKLGKYLGRMEGRTVGQYQITRMAHLNRNGVRKYQIVDLKPPAGEAEKGSGLATREDLEQLGHMLGFGSSTTPPSSLPSSASPPQSPPGEIVEDPDQEELESEFEGGPVDPDELDA